VISGYLITSLLLRGGPQLSLLDFWERRFRRIAPAAVVMTLVCLVAGWLILLPRDFVRLGQSVVAQTLFASNVYFWRHLNYFATDEVRPLLHTWSLAVEEQFYFVLPLLLFALRRAPRRTVFFILAAAAAASFAISVVGVRHHPSATFYLLPGRAWELLGGALIATQTEMRIRGRWLAEALGGAGLVMILGAALLFNQNTPFPGEAALMPCLGAAAVIVGTTAPGTLVGRLLSSKPLVGVGAVSYSLYLWHWPLIAFFDYRLGPEHPWREPALLTASVLLAWSSFAFVEQPLRTRRLLPKRRQIFLGSAVAAVAFMLMGIAIVRADGVASRFRPSTLRYADGKLDADFRAELDLASVQRGEFVPLGVVDPARPVELLVWGDSHAMAILHAVDAVCRERDLRCVAATHSSTPPLLDFWMNDRFSLREQAPEFARAVVQFVKQRHVPHVLLTAIWSGYAEKSASKLQTHLEKTLGALVEAGAHVEILEDVPFPGFDVPIALANADAAGADISKVGLDLAVHARRNAEVNRILTVAASRHVDVLDPIPLFDDGSGFCPVARDGRPLYFDNHHLSTFGSMLLKPLIERTLSPE